MRKITERKKRVPFKRACDSPNIIFDESRTGADQGRTISANTVSFSLKNPDRAKRGGHTRCEGKKGESREGRKKKKRRKKKKKEGEQEEEGEGENPNVNHTKNITHP